MHTSCQGEEKIKYQLVTKTRPLASAIIVKNLDTPAAKSSRTYVKFSDSWLGRRHTASPLGVSRLLGF